jgi:hypothetical protein
MQEFLGAVLGIRLSLQGMGMVRSGLQSLSNDLRFSRLQIENAASGLKALGTEAALSIGALMKAGEDQTMRLQLEAITHSGGLAMDQIRFVRSEAEKGLGFDKSDIFQTVRLFDLAHASLSRFMPLTEELALRSGKSLHETARYIAELSGGGTARLMGLLKPAGITVEQLRAAGLNVNDHYQTTNSAPQILAALEKITSQSSLTGALGGSFMAAYRGDLASIADLLRSIGDGLIPIATPVLQFLGGMVKTITLLNDITGGWASNIVLAVWAFNSISKVLPLLAALIDAEKIAAYWGGIMLFLNNPWGSIVSGITKVVGAIQALANVERIAAAWTAILDALSGNWTALAVGAGVAAAVGVGWYFANRNQDAPDAPGSTGGRGPARTPRRSSYENMVRDRLAPGMGA